jgi:N-acetylmuramic acid 6-phosphate etherase
MANPEKPAGRGAVTEAPNPRTLDLDRLPIDELLARIVDEDARVAAVRAPRCPSSSAPARCWSRRWSAAAAGSTWGGHERTIGALDAAEIPPTFGLEPDRVQA